MSEASDAAEQKERNWGTTTPKEFRAEMDRMRDELTKETGAFISTLDAYARPAAHTNPSGTNDTKLTGTKEVSDF